MGDTTQSRDRIRAVIFDWAGTIVDHGCFGPVVAFQDVFVRAGVPLTTAEAREPMGLPKKDHLRAIAAMPAVRDRWEQRHGKPFSEADLEELYAAFTGMQISVLKDHCDVIPGAIDVINGLRSRGVGIGSTTGYVRMMMNEVIPRVEAQGLLVDAVVCADEVAAGRPQPWMAFKAMEYLGVFPPQLCLKVGDTLPDVQEGRSAGMWTVAVTDTGSDLGMTEQELRAMDVDDRRARSADLSRRLTEAGAHYVIPAVRELPALMKMIEERMAQGARP
jgi:phosphonoacetaldehyde hydrolase